MVELAERATLGSLLLQPQAFRQVAGWLRADDFTDPWHRHVYRAITDQHRAGHPVTALELARVLVDWLGPARAEVTRIHDLLTATPIAPDPARYARMVLETSIRTRTPVVGLVLRQVAHSAAHSLTTSTGGGPRRRPGTGQRAGDRAGDRASDTMDASGPGLVAIDAYLTDAEDRWQAATHPPTPNPTATRRDGDGPATTPAPSRPGPVQALLRAGLQADRALAGHSLDTADVRGNEQALIVALATRPEALPAIRRWWRAEHVTDPVWRPVYAALLELTAAGAPVDAVTLAWQLAQGAPRYGPGPNVAALLDRLEHSPVTDPGFAARAVGADLLHRYATHAAATLTAAAANPGLTVPDLLGTTSQLTSGLTGLLDSLTPAARPRLTALGAASATRAPVPRPPTPPTRPAPLATAPSPGSSRYRSGGPHLSVVP